MDTLIYRRFVVTGRVQGVFFRASTAREAERLGLRGWARNLPDGRVEVLAIGTETNVGRLAEWLRRGPPRARVDGLDAKDETPERCTGVTDFRTG